MRGNGDAGKDPRQLQREVNEQRREIGETIQALEEKFSSRELYNYAMRFFRDHGRDVAQSVSDSVKANPLPIALTSIGLVWMMMGQRQPGYRPEGHRTGDYGDLYAGETGEPLRGQAESVREKVAASGQQIRGKVAHMRERARGARDQFRGSAGQARESLSQSVNSARDTFGQTMREQPLALGALGIALGALLGASLPAARKETSRMEGSQT